MNICNINKRVFKFVKMSVTIDTTNTESAGKTICVPDKNGNALVAVETNPNLFFKEIPSITTHAILPCSKKPVIKFL